MKPRPASAGVVALSTLLAACGGGEQPTPPPPDVTVVKPERRDVRYFREFPGNTRAIEFTKVRARVPGTLEEQKFDPSSIVTRGQVLFVIEPEPYRASYDEARASLASARSQLAAAESDLERMRSASETNAVSKQDLDRAVAARDQAAAAVMGAQARFDQAGINLGYTEVRAPIRGMVSRRLVDIGNLVGAGEPTVLTTVTRMDPMYVFFNAAEQYVLEALRDTKHKSRPVEGGDTLFVDVGTAIDEGFPFRGHIDFINNTVDAATGTIEIRAVIQNEGLKLFPGLFVRVRVAGALREDALLVHEEAIGTDLGGKYVLTVDAENVVDRKYVTLGPVQDDGKIVVEEGLEGDERYILGGLLRARPGFPVNPTEPEGS